MARRESTNEGTRLQAAAVIAALAALCLAWWVTWRGVQLGVVRRSVLELWVHGRQPGWLDWVPFIHPPGYSLFMNGVAELADRTGLDPGALVFWGSGALTLAALAMCGLAARRWFGAATATWVVAFTTLSPQNLRPFEHYPLARLLLLAAFIAVLGVLRRPSASSAAAGSPPGPRRLAWVTLACFAAVEVHLSAWFVLGPLLFGLALSGPAPGRAGAKRVLAGLLVAFGVTTLFGLAEVLDFGVGHKPGRGAMSIEWANPALLLGLLLALALGPLRIAAASLVAFAAITFGLQARQLADGSPFPFSLHYFELIGPPAALVLAATARDLRGRIPTLALRLGLAALLGSQIALFARGLMALFAQPRWILMVW